MMCECARDFPDVVTASKSASDLVVRRLRSLLNGCEAILEYYR